MSLAAIASASILCMAQDVETRAFFSTNADGAVGKQATISIDGEFDDWSNDMIVATCGANDMANAFHGSHENCVIDMYALYAAWDETNLYIGWQMCNTGDTWAREGDGPLTDYGRIGNVPLIVALSVNPGATGMTGKLENGGYVWEPMVGHQVHVDHLFYMSAQVGQGAPAMFKAVDASGNTNYGNGCTLFTAAGIKYQLKYGFKPSHLWRQKTAADWADAETLISDPSIIENIYDVDCYDNLLAGPVEGLKPHDTKFDTFYEMSIPLKTLGINKEWLETYGIGCRVIGTRGESGIDCVPFDPSMVDNVFEKYAKDTSTSHEKDDEDILTYAMASIGHLRDGSVVPPAPEPVPDPEPEPDPDASDYDVYFVDQESNSWAQPRVWLWTGSANYSGGVWPGAQMTATTIPTYGNAWKYEFSTSDDMTGAQVIFNNGNSGNGNQTNDLPFENHGVYNRAGKIDTLSGINTVSTTDVAGEKIYFNMQGIMVENPQAGQLYIEKEGSKVSKVLIK